MIDTIILSAFIMLVIVSLAVVADDLFSLIKSFVKNKKASVINLSDKVKELDNSVKLMFEADLVKSSMVQELANDNRQMQERMKKLQFTLEKMAALSDKKLKSRERKRKVN